MILRFIRRIHQYWNSHGVVASMTIFLVVFIFFVTLNIVVEGDPKVDDHYFHFKYAYLLRTEPVKAVSDFNWISPSNSNSEGRRYEVSLFQVSLIPFTFFDDWIVGLQVADAFYGGLAMGVIYFVFRKMKIRYPLFFVILLFSSTYFLSRILSGRAFVFITGLIFVELYLATTKKYKELFFVVLLHVLWHQNTYFMPFILISIVEISRYFVSKEILMKTFISIIMAILLGAMMFPNFPHSIFGWMNNIFQIQSEMVVEQSSISGDELKTKDFEQYFLNAKIFFSFIIFSIVSLIFLLFKHIKNYKNFVNKHNQEILIWTHSLGMFMLVCLVGSLFISGRFFDFLIPTVFVLSASLVTIFLKDIKKDFKYLEISIVALLGIMLFSSVPKLAKELNVFSYKEAGQVVDWIEKNSTKQKNRIFLHNWSNFTIMFFENSNDVYSTGIEPLSLKSVDESLYWKYYNFFKYDFYCEELRDCGEEVDAFIMQKEGLSMKEKKDMDAKNGEKIIQSIKNDFNADFIVSSSPTFSGLILYNLNYVEAHEQFISDDYFSEYSSFDVFKLK